MCQPKNTTNKADSSLDKTASTSDDESITKEFLFNDLQLEDRMIIYTKNSQYYFRVLDPLLRIGILSGGFLGNRLYRAALLSTQISSVEPGNYHAIRLNSKIVFLVENKNKTITTLFTSPIKTLKLSRKLV
ncbi:MAG: hypothetical protein HY819_24340 [Acidobacteria bacterium]|nr:hypothetical protein [Acidobacteriota bacterium]